MNVTLGLSTQCMKTEIIAGFCFCLCRNVQQLEEIKTKISAALSDMFFSSMVEEWLGTHLQPLIDKIRQCEQTAGCQLAASLGKKNVAVGDS